MEKILAKIDLRKLFYTVHREEWGTSSFLTHCYVERREDGGYCLCKHGKEDPVYREGDICEVYPLTGSVGMHTKAGVDFTLTQEEYDLAAWEVDPLPEGVRAYILAHWDQYGLGLKKQEDMIELLNILEAHAENLDSLHDVVLNYRNEFCGIVFCPETDADVVRALMEFNVFYRMGYDDELFKEHLQEYCEEDECDEAEFYRSEDIRVTRDGIVRVLHY